MTQSPTRQAAIRILQAGPDMPVAIREREKELRAMADDIGMDYRFPSLIGRSRAKDSCPSVFHYYKVSIPHRKIAGCIIAAK